MSCYKYDIGDKVRITDHSNKLLKGKFGIIVGFYWEINCYSIKFINSNNKCNLNYLDDTYASDDQLVLLVKSNKIKSWLKEDFL